jgi:DNA/RNA endonuclease YhcR with UshA esterase domain
MQTQRLRASIGCLATLFLFGCSALIAQTGKLTAAEARGHVGEHATVCGNVVSSRYASSSRGAPTFLDLDAPYPRNPFTIVIWGENRAKFGDPEEKYRGKNICVAGNITSYRGTPEMVISEPSQISEEK